MDKEQVAVGQLQYLIGLTKYCEPSFNSRDKVPIWDGEIEVYNAPKPHRKKENQIGTIRVQIKGTEVKTFTQKVVKYRVSKSDLRRYKEEGGTIFFDVLICGNRTEVFYSVLLPYVIMTYMKASKTGSKSIAIPLKPMPTEVDEIDSILVNAVSNRLKQSALMNMNELPDITAIKDNLDQWNLGFSYTAVGAKNRSLGNLLGHELYLYAENKESGVTIPFKHLADILDIGSEVKQKVTVNGKEYYDGVMLHKSLEYDEIVIGKWFRIKIYDDTSKNNIKYDMPNDLKSRLKAVDFLLAALQADQIMVGCNEFGGFNITKIGEDYLNVLENQKNLLEEYCKVIDFFGITYPVVMDNISDESNKWSFLYTAGVCATSVEMNPKPDNYAYYYSLSGVEFAIEVLKQKQGCIVRNFFKNYDGEDFYTKDDDNNKCYVSKYTILKKEDFVRLKNIDSQAIIESVQRYQYTEPAWIRTNNMSLNMISAYDESGNEELLKTAEIILRYLCDHCNSVDKDLYLINIMQCVKRKKALDKESKKAIEDVIDNSSDNMMKCSCCILLDYMDMAKHYLEKMDTMDAEYYKKYPIYHLYREPQNL